MIHYLIFGDVRSGAYWTEGRAVIAPIEEGVRRPERTVEAIRCEYINRGRGRTGGPRGTITDDTQATMRLAGSEAKFPGFW